MTTKLAKHFDAPSLLELARQYLTDLDRPYEEGDLHQMAFQQIEAEREAIAKKPEWLFCDTDLLTFLIWWEVKYGSCPQKWIATWKANLPELYLLMDIDIPWEKDPLREHPNRREELKDLYISKLDALNLPYRIISGKGEQRLENAVQAVSTLIKEDDDQ